MALMTNSSRNSSAEVASNDAQGSAPQRNGFSSHFDAYLQMQTPSHAYRLMLMHADPEVGQRMLPGGGGEAVLEAWHPKLHPYRELIHIRNLAVTPLEFKRWLDTSILRFNITRAFFVSSQAALDMADLVRQLESIPSPQGPVRLMCYPKSNENWLAEHVPTSWKLHPVVHDHTLHAVVLSPSCVRYELRPAEETYKTPCIATSRVPGQPSKAAGKLSEALAASGFSPRGEGAAIDVGAAPGGWTLQIAKFMHLVVAIDPAELHPEVDALPNVVHLQKKSQEAGDELFRVLGGCPVDLIVCDANRHPLEIMDTLRPLLGVLRPGGFLLLTLKFRGKGWEKEGSEALMLEVLGPGFERVKLLWLFCNTQFERTLVAVRTSALVSLVERVRKGKPAEGADTWPRTASSAGAPGSRWFQA